MTVGSRSLRASWVVPLAMLALREAACAATFPAQELRLDFGAADSPVADGWTGLTPADRYDPSRGHGWERPPEEAFSRDVHWPGELPGNDAYMRELPLDPLTRDGVGSTAAIVLRIDAPAGEYEVRAWIGDYVLPAKRQVILVNGQTLADDVSAGEGGIWGQILRTAVRPQRGIFSAHEGVLRVTFDTKEKPDSRSRIRAVAIQVRRHVAGPVRLEGTRLVWAGPENEDAAAICGLINAGRFDAAHRRIAALPESGESRYHKACLWEALAGAVAQTDVAVSGKLADRALVLLRGPMSAVDPMAVANRRETLTDFRNACDYHGMMSYKRAALETRKNRWRRFREAANWATMVLPHEPLYWQSQLLAARLYLNMGIEGNREMAEAGKPFIARVLENFPDNRVALLYAGKSLGTPQKSDEWRDRLGGTPGPTPASVAPVKNYAVNDPRAPEWAREQRALLASVTDIVDFWLSKRQLDNGEIGGGFNDDVEVLRRWGALALAIDLPAVNAGIAKMADGLWESSADLREHGYPADLGDVEHNAEDVSDTQPLAMALNYGEPRFVARCLLTSSHIVPTWTGLTTRGRRHFKSYFFSWDQVDASPDRAFDVQLSARAVKPALWAAWYTREPVLVGVLKEWSQAWVATAMSEEGGKPRGLFPAGVRFPQNTISEPWYFVPAYKNLSMTGMYDALLWEHLLGMWSLTGDASYLKPMHTSVSVVEQAGAGPEGSLPWAGKQLAAPLYGRIATWRLMTGDPRHDDFLGRSGPAHVRTLLGRPDEAGVLAAMREATSSNAQNFELLTHEVLFTDRLFMRGHEELAAMFGGGVGISQFPAHAVRWENAGGDLSVWVREATLQRFRARVYNFDAAEKPVAMQHWRLRPGKYRLDVRSGALDAAGFSSDVELRHRGDSIPVVLPPGVECTVELTPLEAFAWDPSQLPDLATETKPSSATGEALKWTIYNLGCVPAQDVTVQLRINGKAVETQTIAEIPAVRDYRLGTTNVTFRYSGPVEAAAVSVDPDDRISEITERNNRSDR
jgi:hypothetical protein